MIKSLRKLIGPVRNRIAPGQPDAIRAHRVELSQMLYDLFQGEVAHGPFKGMKLAPDAHWGSSVHSHQLLGIYEQELLHSMFDVPKTHRTFIEIGSQDGYYAIGALRAGLFDQAHCFEILIEGQQLIADNAVRNSMSGRIEIYGKADRSFASLLKSREVNINTSVILCDIEGGEFEIFDPAMFEELKGAVIFIELHPFAMQNGEASVAELKLAASEHFTITELTTTSRDMSVFPELDSFSDTDRWLLCSEGRPIRMTWLRLDPIPD